MVCNLLGHILHMGAPFYCANPIHKAYLKSNYRKIETYVCSTGTRHLNPPYVRVRVCLRERGIDKLNDQVRLELYHPYTLTKSGIGK